MLLASSIHDMKNSLSLLLNSVGVISQGDNFKNNKELAVLQYEASRVNTNLIQLLGLYRLEENQLSVNIDEHNVYEFIEEQIINNQLLFEMENIKTNIDCDQQLFWYFDKSLLAGVINNVLINDVHYTQTRIDVHASVSDNYLKITISDDGEGYPDNMLHDPLQRLNEINFLTGSTSLGIYFSHHIAQLHKHGNLHGRIALENGGHLEGGNFSIFIP